MKQSTLRTIFSLISPIGALALLLGAAALPAVASSSASSASSDSVSTSVGGSSTSIQKSSDSSSGKDDKVAEGEYRIVEVAEAPARAGTVRLKLQPVAADVKDGEFFLFMPHEAFDQSRLAQGNVITAKPRAYGTEFAAGKPNRPFFLVLADEWFRELKTKVVQL